MLSVEIRHEDGRSIKITGASSILTPKPNTVLFVANKMRDKIGNLESVEDCLAFVLDDIAVPSTILKINKVVFSSNPRKDFGRFLEENNAEYRGETEYEERNFSIISKDAKIANGVKIYPQCYIEKDVEIGEGTIIHSGVRLLSGTRIGRNCVIHDGTLIGTISMSYEGEQRIPQIGGVRICDNVSIGAMSIIGRGAIDDTIIESESKIDCNCSVAHNNYIGRNVMIIGGTCLFGSVTVENDAYISGGVIVRNGLKVGSGAFVGMGSVVMRDVAPGQRVAGNPARLVAR